MKKVCFFARTTDLLFKLGPFFPHHSTEQLSLQALLLHRKVNDACLGRDLGRVVGVRELGRDVKLELGVVFHFLVAEFYQKTAAYTMTFFTSTMVYQKTMPYTMTFFTSTMVLRLRSKKN